MINGGSRGGVTTIKDGDKPNVMKEGLRNMIENLPTLIEHMKIMSKLHKAKFDALKAEGFSDAEALELCKVVF